MSAFGRGFCCHGVVLLAVRPAGRIDSGGPLGYVLAGSWPPVDSAVNRPPATRTVSGGARRRLVGVPHDVPADPGRRSGAGELDHGVAAVQGLLRRQGPDLRLEVDQLVRGPDDSGGDCRLGAALEPFDVVVPVADHDLGGGQDRAGAQRRQAVGLTFHQPGGAAAQMVPGLPDADKLLRDVRDDPLGGVGGRGGAQVRDVVQDGPVRLVADRTHHRSGGGGHGPDELLVAERQQVLQGTAAAGDDDHVHVGVGVELAQCRDHLRDGGVALDGHLADRRIRRPASAGPRCAARPSWRPSRGR